MTIMDINVQHNKHYLMCVHVAKLYVQPKKWNLPSSQPPQWKMQSETCLFQNLHTSIVEILCSRSLHKLFENSYRPRTPVVRFLFNICLPFSCPPPFLSPLPERRLLRVNIFYPRIEDVGYRAWGFWVSRGARA